MTLSPQHTLELDATRCLARADLLFCLSQAFLPPPPAWSVCDWAQPLVDDLNELEPTLDGINLQPLRQSLELACASWAALARQGLSDTWLVEYSRLFLVPPVPVTLNAGVYLEGALGGSSTQMMCSCYEMAGVVPDERFHDLPDHVSMQLEFVGRLMERAARGDPDAQSMAQEYAAEFVHHWAHLLEAACRRAAETFPAAHVFVELAALVRQATQESGL